MDLPYEGFRRLSRSEAMQSNTVAITQENTPILRIPGAEMPGVVGFQVEDPGDGNLASCRIRIERERERTVGVQEFTIGSSGTGFVSATPTIGGGSANITGGCTVTATVLNPGVPCTVSAWVDYSPNVSEAKDRCPFVLATPVAVGAGNAAIFGAVPAGCRWVDIFTNQGTGTTSVIWLDSTGAIASRYNGWTGGSPNIAMPGFFLQITNTAAAAVDTGVAWT
jgi:hypothetical protein